MMMLFQVISAAGSYYIEFVRLSWPTFARCGASTVELIVGIVHLIDTEDGFQAALVKGLIMGYQRQSIDKSLYLLPYFGEDRGILCIFCTKSMHLTAPVIIILRFGLDEGIELIHYLPTYEL